jgi:hypothetical protein
MVVHYLSHRIESQTIDENRWDEKAGLRGDAIRSQWVIWRCYANRAIVVSQNRVMASRAGRMIPFPLALHEATCQAR